ncbi:cytidylyltransferase domain-containing protein [Qipengyuania sp. ASV99]|uniref:acylneuraminate cytidylyltransferase family protein n=1 Tax=Qipengyuania sp. ASV99 TaxID=3399681 RepID=UPI003A4C5449
MQHDVLALIPARAGSRRVPGKNTRLLGGKPLAVWTFEAALASRAVGKVLLSTDDKELMALAQAQGIAVLERPQDLAGDHASSVDVATHALESERSEGRDWAALCLLQPTSPFRAEGRIDAGLGLLLGNPATAAVVGVAAPSHHPLHCLIEDNNGNVSLIETAGAPVASQRSQDLPRAWALTGSFYAIRSAVLREQRSFLPAHCLPLVCDGPGEGIDIDWPTDFDRAEAHLALSKGIHR